MSSTGHKLRYLMFCTVLSASVFVPGYGQNEQQSQLARDLDKYQEVFHVAANKAADNGYQQRLRSETKKLDWLVDLSKVSIFLGNADSYYKKFWGIESLQSRVEARLRNAGLDVVPFVVGESHSAPWLCVRLDLRKDSLASDYVECEAWLDFFDSARSARVQSTSAYVPVIQLDLPFELSRADVSTAAPMLVDRVVDDFCGMVLKARQRMTTAKPK